jgi:hypothetical protein
MHWVMIACVSGLQFAHHVLHAFQTHVFLHMTMDGVGPILGETKVRENGHSAVRRLSIVSSLHKNM